MKSVVTLYEQDFLAWTEEQVKLIKDNLLNKLDLVHLQEELISMEASEKRELSHRLEILLMHLLKWKYQPSRQCKSWVRTIKVQRINLRQHLKNNSSLKAHISDFIPDSYEKAILLTADETNLDERLISRSL